MRMSKLFLFSVFVLLFISPALAVIQESLMLVGGGGTDVTTPAAGYYGVQIDLYETATLKYYSKRSADASASWAFLNSSGSPIYTGNWTDIPADPGNNIYAVLNQSFSVGTYFTTVYHSGSTSMRYSDGVPFSPPYPMASVDTIGFAPDGVGQITQGYNAGSTILTQSYAVFESFWDWDDVVEVAPVANFTANQTTGFAPLTVSFTDTSTNTPTSRAWDFNRDGIVDNTTQNPVYTFIVPGTYEVNLTVTNGAGSSTTVKSIVANSTLFGKSFTSSGVQPMWIAGIVVTPNVDVIVSGFNRTTTTSGATNWAIYDNATKTVLKSGELNNEDGAGEANSNPFNQTLIAGQSYIFAFVSNPGVNIHEYGYVPAQTYPQTYGVFTVNAGFNSTVNTSSFVPNEPQGYSDNTWFTINSIKYIEAPKVINVTVPTIVSNFTANQTSGFNPFTVSFTDTSVSQGAITSRAWDFNNDGIVDNTTQNPVHTYNTFGTFSVRLNVSNGYANDTELKTSYIVVSNIIANFTANQTFGIAPLTVSFTDTSQGTVTGYAWDFNNDGIVDNTTQNPVYMFSSGGNYSVRLNVTNAVSNDTEFKVNYVNVVQTPVANFTANQTNGTNPLTVSFTDTSTNSPVSWQWDLNGDNITDNTSQNPVYTYFTPGNYTVTLTAVNVAGNDSEIKTGYIVVRFVAPVASFVGSPLVLYVNDTVQFNSSTSTGNITTYAWDFQNDGVVDSSATNPSYAYPLAGTYSVNLTVTGPGGSNTLVRTSYVVAYPLPRITSFCGPIVYPNELDAPSIARFGLNFTVNASSLPVAPVYFSNSSVNSTLVAHNSFRYAPPFVAPNSPTINWANETRANITISPIASGDIVNIRGNVSGYRTSSISSRNVRFGIMNGNNGTLYSEITLTSLQNIVNTTTFNFNLSAEQVGFTGPIMLQFRSSNDLTVVVNTGHHLNVTVISAIPPPLPEAPSTYNISLTKLGNAPRSVSCSSTYFGSDLTRYNCTAPMNFYTPAGNYGLNITYAVNSRIVNHINATVCNYGQLVAFQRTGGALTFPGAAPGVANVQAPENITIRNTGNVDLNLSISANNLKGRSIANNVLNAANFRMGAAFNESFTLLNSTDVVVDTLAVGETSFTTLRAWLSIPQNQYPQDYYSDLAWAVVGE